MEMEKKKIEWLEHKVREHEHWLENLQGAINGLLEELENIKARLKSMGRGSS